MGNRRISRTIKSTVSTNCKACTKTTTQCWYCHQPSCGNCRTSVLCGLCGRPPRSDIGGRMLDIIIYFIDNKSTNEIHKLSHWFKINKKIIRRAVRKIRKRK